VSANATVPFQVTVSTTARPASAVSLRQHTPSPTKPSLPPLSSPLLPLSKVPFNALVTILLTLALLARHSSNEKPFPNLRAVLLAAALTIPLLSTILLIIPAAILVALAFSIRYLARLEPFLDLRVDLARSVLSTMLLVVLAAILSALEFPIRYFARRMVFPNLRLAIAFALATSLMVTAIACGGPSAPTQSPGTPAGTYTLTLTAFTTIGSSTATRSLPLNITVQ
jgi:hypothetical protein